MARQRMSLLVIVSLLAAGLYLIATALLARRLLGGSTGRGPAVVTAAVAVLCHASVLGIMVAIGGGLGMGLYNAGSLTGWLMALILVVTALRHPVADLGIGVFPVAALAILTDALLTNTHAPAQPLAGRIEIHIALAMLAHAVLGLAAAAIGIRMSSGPLTNAYIVDLLPDAVEGTGWGLLRTGFFSVGAMGSTFVGAFADRGLFDLSFYLMAGLTLGAGVLFLVLPERE